MEVKRKTAPARKGGSKLNRRNTLELLAMAAIPLALLICFAYIPLGGLQLAFKKSTSKLIEHKHALTL